MKTYTVKGEGNILEVRLLSVNGDDVIIKIDPDVYNDNVTYIGCSGSDCPYDIKKDSCNPIAGYGINDVDSKESNNLRDNSRKLANGSYFVSTENKGTYEHTWKHYCATADTDYSNGSYKHQLDELINGRNPRKLYADGFVDAPGDLKYFKVSSIGAYKSSSVCHYTSYMRVFFKYFTYEELYRKNCMLNNNYNSSECRAIVSLSGGDYDQYAYNYCMDNPQDGKNKIKNSTRLTADRIDKCIYSLNSKFRACQQNDGNFVIYDENDNSLFSTGKFNSEYRNNNYIQMQSDSNLVQYKADNNSAYWSSGTSGPETKKAYAVLENNGHLVIYDQDNKSIWTSPDNYNYEEPKDKIFSDTCSSIKNKNKEYKLGIIEKEVEFCLDGSNLINHAKCKKFWNTNDPALTDIDNQKSGDQKLLLDAKAKDICRNVNRIANASDKLKTFCSCINPPPNIVEMVKKAKTLNAYCIDPCSRIENTYKAKDSNTVKCPDCINNITAGYATLENIKIACNNTQLGITDSDSKGDTVKAGTIVDETDGSVPDIPSFTVDDTDNADKDDKDDDQSSSNFYKDNEIAIWSVVGFIIFIIIVRLVIFIMKGNQKKKMRNMSQTPYRRRFI